MPTTLSDSAAEAAERLINRRIDELGSDTILGLAFGEVTVEDWDALRELRQALRHQSTTNGDGDGAVTDSESPARIAIGRHAYDYLVSLKWDSHARKVLENVKLSKTLIGLELTDDGLPSKFVDALRSGATEARERGDELAAGRLERAAERITAAC